MFYTDVNLFQDQGVSDTVLEDVSCMLGCTRSSLHVVASEKGVVVGRLTFREAGDAIDCQRMGVGGKAIPPHIDKVRGHCQQPLAGPAPPPHSWRSASCEHVLSPVPAVPS